MKNVIFIYTLTEDFQFQPNLSKKLYFTILPMPVLFTPPFAARANMDANRTLCHGTPCELLAIIADCTDDEEDEAPTGVILFAAKFSLRIDSTYTQFLCRTKWRNIKNGVREAVIDIFQKFFLQSTDLD